jgi:hypothetical protein
MRQCTTRVILTSLVDSFAKAREVVKGTVRDALRKSLLANEVLIIVPTFTFRLCQASVNEGYFVKK